MRITYRVGKRTYATTSFLAFALFIAPFLFVWYMGVFFFWMFYLVFLLFKGVISMLTSGPGVIESVKEGIEARRDVKENPEEHPVQASLDTLTERMKADTQRRRELRKSRAGGELG